MVLSYTDSNVTFETHLGLDLDLVRIHDGVEEELVIILQPVPEIQTVLPQLSITINSKLTIIYIYNSVIEGRKGLCESEV